MDWWMMTPLGMIIKAWLDDGIEQSIKWREKTCSSLNLKKIVLFEILELGLISLLFLGGADASFLLKSTS